MPAAATHVEFGKDFLDAVPSNIRSKVTDMKMFWIGTQGPDILYFSHMSVLPGSLHKFGNIVHEKKVREAIAFMRKYVKNDPQLMSYYYGYMCHYALDRKAHELICSIARYEFNQYGKSEGVAHIRMEAEIDAYVCNRKGRQKHKNIWKSMNLNKEERYKLSKLYSAMFYKVYGIRIPWKRLDHAMVELFLWNPIIRPRYIGQTVTFGFEFIISSPKVVKDMVLHGEDPKIIINVEEKAYPTFYDPKRYISKSFPELYSEALEFAYALIKNQNIEDIDANFMGEPISGS